MEYDGYELEAAEGTFELLVREALRPGRAVLRRGQLRGHDADGAGTRARITTATVTLQRAGRHPFGDGDRTWSRARAGLCAAQVPVVAVSAIADVRLTDYKVRVLDSKKGTAAKVRVLVEWSDHRKSWSTVGVSENVIEASWLALVDAIRLELMRLTEKDDSIEKAVEDYCWGV